ncbi:NAD-glutamate dehydrogenase [Propioniciclava coleopterorum]|uniref:NAD-glutamate dehydrogenase n=1 Tax=Propioniciclava coleopterorum TaxID=2714937 RepID=A0A6G7Y9E4_9ACTN|nr:NAD-glutamate dehydrogenase [Propioniciclava coleopterorum]
MDTSDHEVNIKILLQPAVAEGRLGASERVELLESMTDEVARLVLAHNIDQNLALSVEAAQKPSMAAAYETWMQHLESAAGLDRDLEGLPSREEMVERIHDGTPLTRPELASLLAWTKIHLERLVVASPLPDDPYLANRLTDYFPSQLRETYAHDMARHPLRREIVATVTVNRFVNSQGISAFSRLSGETASDITEVVKAQLAARTIFSVATFERQLPRLGLPAPAELKVRVALQQMIERGTRWLLHNRRGDLDIRAEEAAFTGGVREVLDTFTEHATPRQRAVMAEQVAELEASGVPAEIAEATSRALWAHQSLPIVDLSRTLERPLELVSSVYFAISGELGLDVVFDRVNELDRSTRWDTMARAALRDDLQTLQTELTRAALQAAPEASDAATVVTAWRDAVGGVDREAAQLAEITDGEATLARMSVALRTIRTLLV